MYKIITKLPTHDELEQELPISKLQHQAILKHRTEIKNILLGIDKRLIVIVGPCSAWPNDAIVDYGKSLAVINEKVKNKLKLVMRTYMQKSRTSIGWAGPLIQPNPLARANITQGIRYARNLMLEIVKLDIAIADEALFTHNVAGTSELISWAAVGARSCEDPEHRMFASLLDCPVGIKNPTSGAIEIAINAILSAQSPQTMILNGLAVETSGNSYAHLVLRGANSKPNYSIAELEKTMLSLQKVVNPAFIIDVSHDNCIIDGKKDYKAQGEIVFNIIQSLREKPEIKKLFKGFMLESFIKEGRQDISNIMDLGGLSITDPCISIEQTQEILLTLAQNV